MERIKFLLITACLALIVLSVALYFRNNKTERGVTRLFDALPENVDMQLTGISFKEVDQFGNEWSMEAKTLNYYKSTDLIVLDKVKATFNSAQGPTHVASDKGYYEKTNRKVKLVGHVMAEDSQGRHLSTEEAKYDLDNGTFQVPGTFLISGPKMDLKGLGLWANTKTMQYKVLSQADVVLKTINSQL
ncbi:MAG: LPS export ABC transporter periplasmic protein LptC [Deltaproteobacteria bacterium]|nr:LPS export ABC transporter periplasmic protein LptC [Deltaproteobacteria bacterium]